MNATLAKTGWSVAEWAAKAGVAKSTIFRALKPEYEFVTSSRTLEKLARAAGVQPPVLSHGLDGPGVAIEPAGSGVPRLAPVFLPVRYKVQAGLWFEMDADEPPEQVSHPVIPDPRYAGFPQWLEKVVGDSVNLKIPSGQYAHVVDAIALGYAPREGDWVVAERRRGGLRERTVKQVGIDENGVVGLWPRSTNPRWSEALTLTDGARPGEEIEVEIVGLVIGAYNPDF